MGSAINNKIDVSNTGPFVLFGGINVLESRELALRACAKYVRVTTRPRRLRERL